MEATAYWTIGPRQGALRREPLRAPADGEARVRALASGVSRGTELLVHRHEVPDAVRAALRAPFQAGDLPGPVKYGYLSVGVVEAGPDDLVGRRVFCLHPHQDRYVVGAGALTPVPDAVPTPRAVLAGTVETAINALWDGPPRWGDRVAVVGAGMVGLALALLLRSFPLGRLEVVDPAPERRAVADAVGLNLVAPGEARGDCDLVFHASATEAGLAEALGLLGIEGELVELSWFGDTAPHVPLGLGFHARRLTLRSSQVGRVAPARAARRTASDRLVLALDALADPAFDRLLAPPVPFAALPSTMEALDAGAGAGSCQVVTYPEEP